MAARLFLCYRRADESGLSGRLYDRLVARQGKHNVFRDLDSIPGGADLPAHIRRALAEADVVLALFGPRWADGRLLDPKDWVRRELEIALELKKRIVPLLLEGAPALTEAQLPQSLRPLVNQLALTVRRDPDFEADLQKLLAQLPRPQGLRLAGFVAACVAVTAWLVIRAPAPQPSSGTLPQSTEPPATLTLTCSPDGSMVSVDGTKPQPTPAEIPVPKGHHQIEFTKDGYISKSIDDVSLEPGARVTKKANLTPKPSSIFIRSANPNVLKVEIDGSFKGPPTADFSVDHGHHTVVVRDESGMSLRLNVDVPPGVMVDLAVELKERVRPSESELHIYGPKVPFWFLDPATRQKPIQVIAAHPTRKHTLCINGEGELYKLTPKPRDDDALYRELKRVRFQSNDNFCIEKTEAQLAKELVIDSVSEYAAKAALKAHETEISACMNPLGTALRFATFSLHISPEGSAWAHVDKITTPTAPSLLDKGLPPTPNAAACVQEQIARIRLPTTKHGASFPMVEFPTLTVPKSK